MVPTSGQEAPHVEKNYHRLKRAGKTSQLTKSQLCHSTDYRLIQKKNLLLPLTDTRIMISSSPTALEAMHL